MINVMVNGLPGKMATEIAERVVFERPNDFNLVSSSITGPEISEERINVKIWPIPIYLNPISKCNPLKILKVMKDRYQTGGDTLIAVDFTHPDAVNKNADMYCLAQVPFVMGTTGGDRKALEERVGESVIPAVVAPNMAMPIVSLQAFMKEFSKRHENGMKNHLLVIRESHQQGKVDTSGTAKAMVDYFNKMGINFDVSQIEMIRDPVYQRALGVPEEHLGGHGWHTYSIKAPEGVQAETLSELKTELFNKFFNSNPSLSGYKVNASLADNGHMFAKSPRGDVLLMAHVFDGSKMNPQYKGIDLEFTHNVNGRGVYVDGTIEAIKFLDKKAREGYTGFFTMGDVLKEKAA